MVNGSVVVVGFGEARVSSVPVQPAFTVSYSDAEKSKILSAGSIYCGQLSFTFECTVARKLAPAGTVTF